MFIVVGIGVSAGLTLRREETKQSTYAIAIIAAVPGAKQSKKFEPSINSVFQGFSRYAPFTSCAACTTGHSVLENFRQGIGWKACSVSIKVYEDAHLLELMPLHCIRAKVHNLITGQCCFLNKEIEASTRTE